MNLQPRINYGAQFAILLGLTGMLLLVGSLATMLIASSVLHTNFFDVGAALLKPEHAVFAQWANMITTFVAFFIPTFITASIANKNPFGYIQFNTKINFKQVLFVIALVFFGMILSGILGSLTEKIPLPATLYKKAKALEDQYDEALSAMITLKTFKDYLIALIVVALAPAIFEETLFRGGFQKILTGWTKNVWLSVILTSIFFSAVHFSYFGFLSRAALGILLGFVFYYSGNIWLNILLHFLNNGIAVTQVYFLIRSGQSIDKAMKDDLPVGDNIFVLLAITIVAVLIIIEIFKRFKTESKKVNPDAAQIISVANNNPFENE